MQIFWVPETDTSNQGEGWLQVAWPIEFIDTELLLKALDRFFFFFNKFQKN